MSYRSVHTQAVRFDRSVPVKRTADLLHVMNNPCPNCGFPNFANAQKCRQCGQKLAPGNQERFNWARRARRLSVFYSLMLLGPLLVLLCEGLGLRESDLPTNKVGYVMFGVGALLALLDFLGIELFRDQI